MAKRNLYDVCHEVGGMTAYEWARDPKRVGFILARYKFVAKMLAGLSEVLEVGCADGFGTRLVAKECSGVSAIDIDKKSIGEAERANESVHNLRFLHGDFLAYYPDWYLPDAVFALDVIEHIPTRLANRFIEHASILADVFIVGTPSLESQKYASTLSKEGHVNCYSGEALRKACRKHFKHVFMFGMNDETVHTGFLPMAHYLFAVCTK